MEDFYTIQGEGAYQGQAAYFIRLGGCDVGCIWCDVKDSWEASAHPAVSVSEITARASASASRLAVLTGGEPLMYDISALTRGLKEAGFRIHIETSGAYPLSGDLDWICFSPKRFKKPLPEVCAVADELKIIIFAQSDFAWAEEHAASVSPHCKLLLQPEWSKREKMTPRIIDYVKNNPKWQISLQSHKYMQIP
ncbi:MAG: radical SAM protein [Bernardetiaceae bacterium]|nr:radical SAM protein [Bernardetiaceae bacterium]